VSANQTKVATIKDLLADIAIQDATLVHDTNVAMERMARLGLSPEQVRKFLDDAPPTGVSEIDESLFHGFASRRQASLAAFGGMSKSNQPGALAASHGRIDTLIKVQVPERAAQTIGLAIVSIPAPAALPVAGETEENVKRFRRLPDGRMREIKGVEDPIDVDVEPVAESTYTMKRAERK